jgi:O-antigen/teichoic acid export membrane protein
LAARGSQLAYVGMILTPLFVQASLTTFMSWRLGWLPQVAAAFRQRPLRADINHFITYFAANLAGGLINAGCMLALRATIIEIEGQDANGLFQAAWTLTQQNLVLLMASFATYLLPTLSATHDQDERQRFLDDTLPVVIVLTVPMAGVGLLFMPLVLRLLYSAEFLPAIAMLRWMLLANLFSALITVLVILLLARNRPVASAVTEVGWYLGFAGTGIAVLTGVFDPSLLGLGRLEALGAAFFTFNTIRLICLLLFCRATVSYVPSPDVWRVGIIGFALLLFAAWQGWSAETVNWLTSIPSALLICAAPLSLLNRQRFDRLRSFLHSRFSR